MDLMEMRPGWSGWLGGGVAAAAFTGENPANRRGSSLSQVWAWSLSHSGVFQCIRGFLRDHDDARGTRRAHVHSSPRAHAHARRARSGVAQRIRGILRDPGDARGTHREHARSAPRARALPDTPPGLS